MIHVENLDTQEEVAPKRKMIDGLVIFKVGVVLILVVLAALAYLTILGDYDKSAQRQTDFRECSTRLGSDHLVEGTRKIIYQENTLFGHKLVDKDSIAYDTTFKLNGSSLTVMGKNYKGYWVKQAGQGEQGNMSVPDADEYIIVRNGEFTALSFDDFCRPISTQKILTLDAFNQQIKAVVGTEKK